MAANRAAAVDLTSLTPGQLCEEVHNRVAARVKERLMGGDPWAQDPVGMHLQGYRERYYEVRACGVCVGGAVCWTISEREIDVSYRALHRLTHM